MVKDWCVGLLCLAVTAGLVAGALAPRQTEARDAGCREVRLLLIPDNPLPGETVSVRVSAAGYAPGSFYAGWWREKHVLVTGGEVSALVRTPHSGHLQVAGPELAGDLSCLEWNLPESGDKQVITVTVGDRSATAAVRPGYTGGIRPAVARHWLRTAVNFTALPASDNGGAVRVE